MKLARQAWCNEVKPGYLTYVGFSNDAETDYQSALQQLHLSGLAQSLDVRLAEAGGHQLNHAEFLELILQDENGCISFRPHWLFLTAR